MIDLLVARRLTPLRYRLRSLLPPGTRSAAPLRAVVWLAMSVIGFAGLSPHVSYATDSPFDSSIMIEGDTAELDESKETLAYSGNVVITNERIQIRGASLLVQFDQDDITDITTQGSPATFTQKSAPGVHSTNSDEPSQVQASATSIVYFPASNRIEMTGAARLSQGSSTMTGERIEYDLDTGRFAAQGSDSASEAGNGRVRLRLQPSRSSSAAASDKPKPADASDGSGSN